MKERAMKTSQPLLIVLAVGLASSLISVPSRGATDAENPTPLSELSGILHKDDKTIMPYLALDGSGQRCYLKGNSISAHRSGNHVSVRGTLRSELLDATAADWSTGAKAPPPFLKGWVVLLDVQDAKAVADPIPASTEDKPPTKPGPTLKCEILTDPVPYPLIVRVTNPLTTAVHLRTFQSTHMTMPPMPNVRLTLTDRTTRETQQCTPVGLGQPRGRIVINPGETRDVPVYYRGLRCEPGNYDLTVSLFDDADVNQNMPLAVTPALLVRKMPRSNAPTPEP
jgi:hypothetical protein